MKKIFLSLLLIVNLFVVNSFSQTETTLTVHVTGYENNIGQTLLKLFRKSDDVTKKPFMIVKVNIVNNKATFLVKNIAYGDYAVIVVHDQNSNGEIDHSWGMPSEPLGFSNNWKLGVFSGMPSFEKLKFPFSKINCNIAIKID